MIIRVRTPNGTHRVDLQETDTLQTLKSKIAAIESTISHFELYIDAAQKNSLQNDSASLKSLNLKHGDMVFLKSTGKEEAVSSTSFQSETQADDEEDSVDKELATRDGWIERQRDPRLCKHGQHGRCNFCMPIPPWDFINHDPWKSEGIRFIPFHAYLKKTLSDSGCKHPEYQKCLYCKSLDIPSYRVKPCTKHPPWPEGICTECRPKACRIDSQSYRHVDRVLFDTPEIIDQFLQFWRESGNQRCGYLYGKYVIDDYIPLGIQAVVSAIYEPPQKNTRDGVTLEKDPDAERVEVVANMLGLQKVGYIWTDLQTDASRRVIQSRVEYPLTSQEIIEMAKRQNKTQSACKKTTSGKLGSKFVSVLITGNAKGEITPSAFQVSDQCMQLVKDGIITFSSDPALLRVKKTSKRFIPDVMYQRKNEYGLEVIEPAAPTFPSEFFVVRLSESASKKPNPLFRSFRFPIENRSKTQSLSVLKSELTSFDSSSLKPKLNDFHLFLYLSTQLDKPVLDKLVKFVQTGGNADEVKATLTELLSKVSPAVSSSASQTRATQPRSQSRSSASSSFSPQQQQSIQTLVEMGFQREQVIQALRASDWVADVAVGLLAQM